MPSLSSKRIFHTEPSLLSLIERKDSSNYVDIAHMKN